MTDAHRIAEDACASLLHRVPNLSDAIVHVDPASSSVDPHAATAITRQAVNVAARSLVRL